MKTVIMVTRIISTIISTKGSQALSRPGPISRKNTSSVPRIAVSTVISRFSRTATYMLRPVSARCVSGPRPSRQTTAETLLVSEGCASEIRKRSP